LTSTALEATTPKPISSSEPWSAPGSGARKNRCIFLVHGFTGSPYSLRPLGELLAERGFAVEIPRLPGHGTTWRELLPTRYDDWRAAVHATAKRLEERHEHVLLVGLSMGGTLALDVASGTDARISGVVTINAQILDRDGIGVKLGPYIEKVLPIVPASLAGLTMNDIAKPGMVEEAYPLVPTAAGNSLLRALPRIRAQLANVPCPVLVMVSRNDHSVPPANSKALLELIKAPRLEELVLERSYHVATLDYDQALIEEKVTAFADSV
jgi:carboxylesterase